jgi:hypothetical protein
MSKDKYRRRAQSGAGFDRGSAFDIHHSAFDISEEIQEIA